ncbi:DUF6483 family protein [Enterococcus caccae]|uniref:Uncharacterized protein n=2 Tax=Enterococcus caccae TaxID=317735 RepID=R3WGG8_9ENTE|nr:DUF6483 family protein [Enterococcus caccae]EOL46537.1 hypothetical protein UC7_01506 [Enterococcus caccae ATCC BAA-1240]EOT60906.1 hypothetical protein I580_01808 [Enterococcus caccae ATCC BAA-1240]
MMEYEKDWFMRQVKAAVFNPFKKVSEVQVMPMILVTDEGTGEKYSVPIQSYLSELILALQVNQAENILFSETNQMTDAQLMDLGNWFYDLVENLSDEELESANFSRTEIAQGRADLGE